MTHIHESIDLEKVFCAMQDQQIYMYNKQRSLALYYTLRLAAICYKLKKDKDQKTRDQIEEFKKQYEESFKLSNTLFKRWQDAFLSCFKDKKNITSMAIKKLSDHINKVLYLPNNAKLISLNINFPELEKEMIPHEDSHIFFEKYLQSCNKIKRICGVLSIIDARRQIANFKKYLVTYRIPNDSDKTHIQLFFDEYTDADDTLKNANKILKNLVFHNLNTFRFPNQLAMLSSENILETSITSITSITSSAQTTPDITKDDNKRSCENLSSKISNRPLKMRKYNKKETNE